MTNYYYNSAVTTTSASAALTLVNNDTLLVDRAGSLAGLSSFSGAGVNQAGGGTIANRGTIYGTSTGISAGTNIYTRRIHNAEDGYIFGGSTGVGITTGSGHRLENDGEIASTGTGAYVSGSFAAVRNSGIISGSIALSVQGTTNRIANTGEIAGGSYGLYAPGGGNALANDGLIAVTSSSGTGVLLEGSGATVTNSGTIRADVGNSVAVYFNNPASTGTGNVLENTGQILGAPSGYAVYGSIRSERVVNDGVIKGRTALEDGADTFDGRDGRQGPVDGGGGNDELTGGVLADTLLGGAGEDSLVGGAGNDVLAGGAGADTLEGGDGRDLLDYRGSDAVEVSLALGTGSGGDAAGDVFSGFEWLAGGDGDDALTGDAGDNRIFGGVGLDVLNGAAGTDTLIGGDDDDILLGGAGADVLTGGAGADRFRYGAVADSAGFTRDVVTDFEAGDRLDLFFVDAIAAGGTANDAFAFVGAAAFTAAGQVRAATIGSNTYVYANTDANLATSELVIVLRGAVTLAASDFVL